MAPEQRIAKAKEATKEAYRRMMDAATKTANLFTMCAEFEENAEQAANYRFAAQQWQNTAQMATEHMRKFG